jgi:hypothetical protein
MSAISVHKVFSILVLLTLAIQPLAPAALPDPSGFGKPEGSPPAPTGLYRTTVTVDSPARRARLEALGVMVLREPDPSGFRKPEGSTAVVLATAEQLEALACLRFEPRASDDADALVAAHAASQPALAAAWGELRQRMGADKRMTTAAASPSAYLFSSVAQLSSLDDDADGLTNTEEAWWCTDPLNPNSDGDANGFTDGEEVRALLDFTLPRTVRWGYGPPFGPPNAWPNFNNRDGTGVKVCNDGDYDTIPDYAEVYMVGTRVPEESTDRDKFDDGQELFGITFCPGAPTNCGYGSYPAIEYWNWIQARVPDWVLPPGDNPLVAAFPVPEVYVTPGSWTVQTVTTITDGQGRIIEGTHSYETSVTRGESTSIADTVNWNNWEEVSQAVETPLGQRLARSAEAAFDPGKAAWGTAKILGGIASGAAGCIVGTAFTFGLSEYFPHGVGGWLTFSSR